MITLKHHKFENIPVSSGTALPLDTTTINVNLIKFKLS